jgi:hypothetical protein
MAFAERGTMTPEPMSTAPMKVDARGTRPTNRPRPDAHGLLTDVMVRAVARPRPDADKYDDVPCTD